MGLGTTSNRSGPLRARKVSEFIELIRVLGFWHTLWYRTGYRQSACASPENFDAELGAKIARQHAKDKIWALEGYRLKSSLAAA